MKIALMADSAWLEREAGILRRMVVGLVGEAVRVVPVIPAGPLSRSMSMVSEQVLYTPTRFRWMRRWLLHRLADRLGALEVNLLHALDSAATNEAMILARLLNVPVVCSSWSQGGVERWARCAARARSRSVCYTLPTEPLMRHASAVLGESAKLEQVRPGVLVDEDLMGPVLANPRDAISALVVCHGTMDEPLGALLRAIAMMRNPLPQLQVMLYAMRGGSHKLWQSVAKMKLLEQVTVVEPGPGVRELLIQADVVFQPQALGGVYGVTLEAMAARRPVVAVEDPVVDYLRDGQTARLIREPQASHWAQVLGELVESPQPFRALGESAHAYVVEHHSASAFNEQLLAIYTRMTAEPLPFDDRTADRPADRVPEGPNRDVNHPEH